MKSLTEAEKNRIYRKMAKTAEEWIAKGYDQETVARGIWNKYGYTTDVKEGKVRIWNGIRGDQKIVVEI